MQIPVAESAARGGVGTRAAPAERFEHLVFAGERAAPHALAEPRRGHPPPPRGEREVLAPRSREFLGWLCRQRGLDLAAYRPSALARREPACLRAVRARNLEEARARLERDPPLVDRALSALLIGVTGFLRDPLVFAALALRLPDLHRRHGRLRVVSVGCSDGSELYSVAILLAELGLCDRTELLGIDCRAEAVASARSGTYGERALLGVGKARRERAFLRCADGWRVRPEIARACRFEVQDAFALSAAHTGELVLCRNLAIYLEREAACRLWTRIAELLPPSGVLVTGKAERPEGARPFARLGPCLYRAGGSFA